MGHIVLLGDSILDNGRYVPGGPSVIEHLRRILPGGWRASLLAVDGSTTEGVIRQLDRLPPDATHIVASVGGNDALDHSPMVLHEPAGSFAEVLSRMGMVCEAFQQDYRAMLQAVRAKGLPVVVCTIYDSIPGMERAERTGLRLFNEVILREAFRARLPLIDLRLICTESADYATSSPIEPSAYGGGKIARAIERATVGADEARTGPRIII